MNLFDTDRARAVLRLTHGDPRAIVAAMRTEERVARLRDRMRREALDAYIVYGTDPHQSEYVPEHWRHRHWITGFHGSAGTAVVTLDEAGLWTDSRYYLEAEQALAGTPFRLHRADEPDSLGVAEYLAENLPSGARVGAAAATLSLNEFRALNGELTPRGIIVEPGSDLAAAIRTDRPPLPSTAVYELSAERAGAERSEKLARVRAELCRHRADALLITALDELAWTLNLRGSDIPYNPVTLGYLLVEQERARLFLDSRKLSSELAAHLAADGVICSEYSAVEAVLGELPAGTALMCDPAGISMQLLNVLPSAVSTVEHSSPVARMKAVKNARELTQLRACMHKDGAVMVTFLYWLAGSREHTRITERSAALYLRELRAAQPEFVDESFPPISAAGDHAAIVHYCATDASDRLLEGEELYLIDSGGQYLDGTTDITRTVATGEPSDRVRTEYTAVLQAHIALATITFPYGTTGTQLDAITRAVLWRRHRNFGHGTGHGVGFFLNVHEGPQRLSPKWNAVPLEPGMVVSNEPGLYLEGSHGIRIENLVCVRADRENAFGRFLCLETLTLCPLERRLIDREMLTEHEREWVNRYHRLVFDQLEPHLEAGARTWLAEQTAPL